MGVGGGRKRGSEEEGDGIEGEIERERKEGKEREILFCSLVVGAQLCILDRALVKLSCVYVLYVYVHLVLLCFHVDLAYTVY